MYNYILIALLTSWLIACAFTSSEIFCSKTKYPWKEAITYCLEANGQPMSFHGIADLSIENLHLRPDVTVWTADYFDLNVSREQCLCSFHYLTQESFYEASDELFSHCNEFKYFFCRNKTSNLIEVLNNTWDNTDRCGTFPRDYELESALKPGYYWQRKTTECGFDGMATFMSWDVWRSHGILCGAYNKHAGRHFRRCDSSFRHVCVSSGTVFPPNIFDSTCFLGKNTETTDITKMETLVSSSYQPHWTKPSENVTASIFVTDTTPSVSHTKQSNLPTTSSGGYTTKLPQTSTERTQHTPEIQMNDNSTLGYARGSAYEHGIPETGTVAGTIAGIVVGVCLALTGGVVLFIFIQKRYRCLFDKTTTSNSKPKTNNDTSKISKTSKARTLFNNLAYDFWDDNHHQSQAKQSKRNNIEIPKNGTSNTNQLRTGKDKELPSKGNIIYYNQSDPTYANDLIEAQTTATSTYSFAEETEINVGEKEMSQDDYDTTISTRKGIHKTENLYNKIGPENNSNDVYDSTLRQGQSFETDDVYNKLTCKPNYGKFGTTLPYNEDYDSVGNTLKNQNTVHCTDNVYNKL